MNHYTILRPGQKVIVDIFTLIQFIDMGEMYNKMLSLQKVKLICVC